MLTNKERSHFESIDLATVSYTHLDVYKRQFVSGQFKYDIYDEYSAGMEIDGRLVSKGSASSGLSVTDKRRDQRKLEVRLEACVEQMAKLNIGCLLYTSRCV